MSSCLRKLNQLDPLKKNASGARYAKNAPGKWYVDDSCVDCDLCKEFAISNFKRDNLDGQYYVSKQPSDQKELKQCLKAKNSCPVNAIHNN